MRYGLVKLRKIDTYGSDDAGAVRADQAGLVLGLEHIGDADHV